MVPDQQLTKHDDLGYLTLEEDQRDGIIQIKKRISKLNYYRCYLSTIPNLIFNNTAMLMEDGD